MKNWDDYCIIWGAISGNVTFNAPRISQHGGYLILSIEKITKSLKYFNIIFLLCCNKHITKRIVMCNEASHKKFRIFRF